MNTILCPIDFSEASKNGMEYASHLAKALNASLTLLYVRISIWPEAIQLESEVLESNEEVQFQLSLFSTEVQKEFGIDCKYHILKTTDTFEEAVATHASQFDLVVLGTNGADNFYQYVFGTNSFHVIEKSKCPVVIVPKGCSYKPIQMMVYAYDPETNSIFLIDQLKKLAAPFATEVKVLHITEEKPTSEIKKKMEILHDAVKARESKNISLTFDFTYSDEVAQALDTYIKINAANILALSFHNRTLMERLFSKNVVKQISMVAEYPVFVFWR